MKYGELIKSGKDDFYDKTFINTKGHKFKVKEFKQYSNSPWQKMYDCHFESGFVAKDKRRGLVKDGAVDDYGNPTILNKGIIWNTDLINTDVYWTWHSMVNRVYSEKSLKKREKYLHCELDEKWLTLTNFEKDFYKIKGYEEYSILKNYIKFNLDKDIFSKDGLRYSKETCCLIPAHINQIFTYKQKNNITGFIGVST